MTTRPASIGYQFEPSRYNPPLGFSSFWVSLSDRPTQRFFDAKYLRLPTFDGRFLHHTQVSRHELEPQETFQVCMGAVSLESHSRETLRGFSFGGVLEVKVEGGNLDCLLTSSAPVFHLQEQAKPSGAVIVDELMDLLAEKQAALKRHEDELYASLAKADPYQVFLASLVSLQKRTAAMPVSMRHERYHKVVAELHKAEEILRKSDGWDGRSPDLDELISSAT